MGITIELELFKDGFPVEGDLNDYSAANYKGAIYSADEAFKQDCADEVAFYISVGETEPRIVHSTAKNFDIDKISKKIQKIIEHIGA